jgi:hypothetical protein
MAMAARSEMSGPSGAAMYGILLPRRRHARGLCGQSRRAACGAQHKTSASRAPRSTSALFYASLGLRERPRRSRIGWAPGLPLPLVRACCWGWPPCGTRHALSVARVLARQAPQRSNRRIGDCEIAKLRNCGGSEGRRVLFVSTSAVLSSLSMRATTG